MLVLITYDVNTETDAGKKRLRKVAKQCTNYGRRVQNSVFECILDNAQCIVLKSILADIIDEEKGEVFRIYNDPLCSYSLSDNQVGEIYKDREGGIWV